MNTQSIGNQIMHEQVVDSVMHTINGGMTTAGMFGTSAKRKAEIKAQADEREERRKIERQEQMKIEKEERRKIEMEEHRERIKQQHLAWAALDEAADRRVAEEKKQENHERNKHQDEAENRRVAGEKKHNEKIAAAIEFLRINGIKTVEPPTPSIAEAAVRIKAEKEAYAKALFPHHFL
jgi:hypothetical protein